MWEQIFFKLRAVALRIVDAPSALNVVWSLVKPTLPEGTQRKVVFVSADRALEILGFNSQLGEQCPE